MLQVLQNNRILSLISWMMKNKIIVSGLIHLPEPLSPLSPDNKDSVLSDDLNLSEDDEEEMSGHLTPELEPKPLIMQDDDQLVPPPVDGRWKRLIIVAKHNDHH